MFHVTTAIVTLRRRTGTSCKSSAQSAYSSMMMSWRQEGHFSALLRRPGSHTVSRCCMAPVSRLACSMPATLSKRVFRVCITAILMRHRKSGRKPSAGAGRSTLLPTSTTSTTGACATVFYGGSAFALIAGARLDMVSCARVFATSCSDTCSKANVIDMACCALSQMGGSTRTKELSHA